jgi:colanic acid biosynthesis glycosyl transferase WcaI
VDILYISQYFPPEPGAPAARVYELSRAWVAAGAKVSVLTAFPNHPTGVIPPQYRGKKYQAEVVDGIRVHRTYIYPAANKGLWGRAANYISFALSALITGIYKFKAPDIVIATSPQFLVALAGYVVARMLRAPFVFEVRDLWPASIVAVGALRQGSPQVRLLEMLERYLYRHADHIVVVTDTFKQMIVSKGISEDKITVLKNGVDLKLFHPGPKPEELIRKHHLDGKFVISYVGTIGMAHGVDMILEAAQRLKQFPDIHFVIVGDGAERTNLRACAEREGLANVSFPGSVSRPEVREWMVVSDVCLVPLRDRPIFRTVIPSKMFEIMACARPMILSVYGEAAQLVRQAEAGIVIEPENVEQLLDVVHQIRNQPRRLQEMGAKGRAFVEAHFNRNRMADSYRDLLVTLLPQKAVPAWKTLWGSKASRMVNHPWQG